MWTNPAQATQILEALYNLLPIADVVDNTRIPAGYTYLLQLVAHDLVETTVPFWLASVAGIASRNMRSGGLQLDTLYGGGPTACPMAFKPDGAEADQCTQLRLGRVTAGAAGTAPPAGPCGFRDLPRLKLGAAPPDSNFDDASQVYVADTRNDDGIILAQLVVLFSILHNAMVDRLPNLVPQARFAHTRVAMLQMYYAIIRQDLLRLVLHDTVYESLNARPADSNAWLWRGEGVPLELSHGALRVCHAMVRPFYVFNDGNSFKIEAVLGGPKLGNAVRDPLPTDWIVAWSKFFPLEGAPNYSLKLAARAQLSLDITGILPRLAGTTQGPLTLRDWLSASAARMWRFDALIAAVGGQYPGVTFVGASDIAQWLTGIQATANTADAAIVSQHAALLASDLPLPLYGLLEAQLDPTIDGAHLGALGSIIVGEVLFRHLAEAEAQLSPFIPGARQAFGDAWSRVQDITSMPKLVSLAQDWGCLADCSTIPFITTPIP